MNFNTATPNIMHIDLNSAFATTEQQARPSLRGRPIGVTNRISKNCCVIAASIEAKAVGIKVGMSLSEARDIVPDFLILESDPPKYHYVYQTLVKIMASYSPKYQMKSIDEGIIDFTGTRGSVNHRSLESIGHEIKQRFRDELGEWMRVNVGIAPNQFLAKQAAGWHKPDGLDVLDHRNLLGYYRAMRLTDLSGIAARFEARLNAAGIFTPEQFVRADPWYLRKRVFNSITGEYWHRRLLGFEIDDYKTKLGLIGRQWVLSEKTSEEKKLFSYLHHLSEATGKKLRFKSVDARGILVWANFQNGESFVGRKMFKTTFYSDAEIYRRALLVFNTRPRSMSVTSMGVSCYQITPSNRAQQSMFDQIEQLNLLTTAVDEVNERYGGYMIHAANSLLGKQTIKTKVPFGSTAYLSLLSANS
jgi:DNA polymerase-4